jgi:hypothetical protein
MANLPSGQLAFTIANLENEVLLRCENRTSDAARADVWIRDALLEISGNPDYRDDFPELEVLGPIVNLTPQVQEYAETTFINVSDEPMIVMADMLLWTDFPANTVRRKLDSSHYQKTDRFTPIYSLPTEWYRFAGAIGFNPTPDKAYQVQSRNVKMHPINDAQLNQTTILLPRDWNEILIMAAVQRGFIELMEYEKADAVHRQLYGDPDNKAQPGLIFHVKRKRRKESWRMESRLSFTRRPYMWGH